MTTPGTFGMICMNGPSLHGGNGIIDKATFIQGIGMNRDRDIMFVGKRQTGINGTGCGSTPILMEFQAGRSTGYPTIVQDSRGRK